MKERCPGDGVFVEVDARRQLVDFVSPFAGLNCGVAVVSGEHKRHACSVLTKMSHEGMFLIETCGVAHGAGVALDEDAAFAGAHPYFNNAGGREGTWADTE